MLNKIKGSHLFIFFIIFLWFWLLEAKPLPSGLGLWLWLYGKPNHCLTGLGTGVSFAQERFEYDSQGKPDPFTPWVTVDGRLQILKNQEKSGESALSLEGIIFDKYGLSYIVVNGEVAKIGDTIDGFQVLKIEEKRVIFIRDGELKEVEMKEEGT